MPGRDLFLKCIAAHVGKSLSTENKHGPDEQVLANQRARPTVSLGRVRVKASARTVGLDQVQSDP
jgi:hypothetical protein